LRYFVGCDEHEEHEMAFVVYAHALVYPCADSATSLKTRMKFAHCETDERMSQRNATRLVVTYRTVVIILHDTAVADATMMRSLLAVSPATCADLDRPILTVPACALRSVCMTKRAPAQSAVPTTCVSAAPTSSLCRPASSLRVRYRAHQVRRVQV